MADKQDEILAALNQLIPQVKTANTGIAKTQTEVTNIRIEFARYQEKHENLKGHIEGIGAKLRTHIDDAAKHSPVFLNQPPPAAPPDPWSGATVRWRFLGAVTLGLTALIGLAGLVAKVFQ